MKAKLPHIDADIIDESMWLGTPAEVAAEILMNGYRKGGAE